MQTMTGFDSCWKLSHLDLSENWVPDSFPTSLVTLSLSENEVEDLNEVCYLGNLPYLEQISLLSNPCVSITESKVFDYRPYVLFWIPRLTMLDGMEVSSDELQQSLCLFAPDKPYPFSLGEHQLLTQYLSSINPLKHIHALKGCIERDKLLETSLVELQDLLAKSTRSDQSGLTEKLKALQLVEEMIMTQEKLMSNRRDDGYSARAADEVMAESALAASASMNTQQVGVVSPAKQQLQEQCKRKLRSSRCDITAYDSGCTDEITRVESPSFNSHQAVFSATCKKALDDCKKQQLKKINDKLANRHSNILRRDTYSAKVSACFDGYPANNQKHSVEPEQGNREKQLSTSVSGHKDSGAPAELPVADASLSFIKTCTEEPRTVSFLDSCPLPVTSNENGLLNSESCFIPLSVNGNVQLQELIETPCVEPSSSGPLGGIQDTDMYVSSLLSSLDHAYGYLTCTGTSKPMSNLVEPSDVSFGKEDTRFMKAELLGRNATRGETWMMDAHPSISTSLPSKENKVVCIQACYRGFSTRKKVIALLRRNRAATRIQSAWRGYVARKRNSQVIQVRAELSRIKLEACISTLHEELQRCWTELLDQTLLVRLQGDAMKAMLEEVGDLQLWREKREKKERAQAALVIQRHWRGYLVRKNNPRCGQVSLQPRAIWNQWSINKQIDRMLAAVADLQAIKEGQVPESTPGIQLPCARDVLMTDHSSSCILLKWSSPEDPSSSMSPLKKLGYRVYINGVPEGMVGPTKHKAYIEGLDRGAIYRITVRVVYTIGESKDAMSVIASLDTSTASFSQANSLHHSHVGSNIDKTASDHGALFPNESSGQQLANSNIPAFQAMRPSAIKAADNPVLLFQTQFDNVVDEHSTADWNSEPGEGSSPHQSSEVTQTVALENVNGVTETVSLENVSCVHKAPHITLGDGNFSSGDSFDQVENVQQLFQFQGQQQPQRKLEEQMHDSCTPGLVSICRPDNNTPDFCASGVGAKSVDCFCPQLAQHGPIEHPTDMNMTTGDQTITSSSHLSPSLTICPQDAPSFVSSAGAPLPQPLSTGKLTRFQDVRDAIPKQPGFEHMPAIAQDRSSYYKTKQVPPFTSEDSGCVAVNKTQEQRLLDYDDAFLVECNEHGACLLNMAARNGSAGVGTIASAIDSDCLPTTVCISAPPRSPTGDTTRESSSEDILGSCECSCADSFSSIRTHDNDKQLVSQSGTSTNTNALVYELEECEQTNISCISSEKCFDLGQASLDLPRGSSGSLGEIATVSSSDNRFSEGPLLQTMPVAVTMDTPLINVPLILGDSDHHPRESGHAGAD